MANRLKGNRRLSTKEQPITMLPDFKRRRRSTFIGMLSLSLARQLDDALALPGTPEGSALARAEIKRHGIPIYGTDPKQPGLIVEELPDGTTRAGKFVNRRFVPLVR